MLCIFAIERCQATMLERESTKPANQGDAKETGHMLPWMVRIPVQVNEEAPSYLDEHERPAGVRGSADRVCMTSHHTLLCPSSGLQERMKQSQARHPVPAQDITKQESNHVFV
ncbi:unnamed protein product [Caenorhabditis nigoni]